MTHCKIEDCSGFRSASKIGGLHGLARPLLWIGPAIASLTLSAAPAFAQSITLDGTVGAPATLNGPVYTIPQSAGKTSGSALFHSFGRFGLTTGEVANFQSGSDIRNIFGRVTGGNPSAIDGLIRTQGSPANLFLINPSGILFGPNARLDVSGSFVATTANSIKFPDGSEFSATDPQAAPLLAMTITPGLQYGTRQGTVHNAGVLSVGAGQTVTLLGSQVTSTGSLNAPGGRVEVLGDRVSLLDRAQINVSSVGGGGTVLIGGDFQGRGTVPNATHTFVAPDVVIRADALQQGNGGRVIVWSDRATRFYGSISAKGGSEAGNGGFAEVSGKDVLTYAGQTDLTAANGAIGTLLLDPTNITVVQGGANPAQLSANDETDDPGTNNLITNGTINAATSNVILQASQNITFNAPIAIGAVGVGISAEAGNDIQVNQDIITDGGGISLIAGNKVFVTGATLDPTPVTNPEVGSFVVIGGANGVQLSNSRIRSQLTSSNTSKATTSAVGILSRNGSVTLDGTTISTTNFGTGIAGDVVITAQDKVQILNNSKIFSRGNLGRIFLGPAEAYDISLTPNKIAIANSFLTTDNDTKAGGTLDAGNIFVRASDRVSLSGGSEITSSTFQQGNPGLVFLFTQNGLVSLSGGSQIRTRIEPGGITTDGSGEEFAGGVFNTLLGQGTGKITGSTFISTGSLKIEGEGSLISATTFGTGNAGSVVVLASKDVALKNGGAIFSRSGEGAKGSAGGILIGTNSLTITGPNSALTTQTNGEGDAGLILVNASGRIYVDGRGSGIFSSVDTTTPQAGGGIFLSGYSLIVRNQSGISVSNLSGGEAGSIFVATKGVWVDRDASISATTQTGQGGNIALQTGVLVLTSQGDITTNSQQTGNGGNIFINGQGFRFGGDRTYFISAKPKADSNIVAKAEVGNGGSIFIQAGRLIGIQRRTNDFSNSNDITTKSRFGFDGSVAIDTLNINPDVGTPNLGAGLVDTSGLIGEGCDTRGKLAQGRFVITGRGGIAASPTDEALASEEVLSNWVSVPGQGNRKADGRGQRAEGRGDKEMRSRGEEEIVEAQGWIVRSDGTVMLVASAPNAQPHIPWLVPKPCHRVP
jgi:filamentous hemagglutinin family protein